MSYKNLILLFCGVLICSSSAFAQSASTPTVINGTDSTGFPITAPVGNGSNGSVSMPVTITGGSTAPAFIKPEPLTIVPLDISTVTTGGTAVTALLAGHRTAGGFLQNPIGATIPLCINEQGTASGMTSAGATTCILPGQPYTLTPSAGAVSVITSDSAHPFSGQGLN